jgi:predicted Rossmann fold flavoprotein
MRRFDVIVIGGGAAGMMCALTAGRRGRKVALLEHNERVGKKIAISGGGRCNFTNLRAGPDNYLSASPDFCRSALARYKPADFLALVEQHGIAYHEKTLGQQFCNTSSRAIIEMLVAECHEAGVEILCGCKVQEVSKPGAFELATSLGPLRCDSLVVATGGLSFAKLGATDFGYRIAQQLGLRVTPLRPGLVPLVWQDGDGSALKDLSGLSLPVDAACGGARFAEAVLFTHRGVSGPVILQISSYWNGRDPVEIDLLPGVTEELKAGGPLLPQLSKFWPRRFAEVWCERHAPTRPLAQCSRAEREAVEQNLRRWPLRFSGTEGYPKAEVTLGGVDTRDLSSKTMEARAVPGLFFVGEVVDVTGWLGGYNFQWAWASGNAAGLAV